MPRRFIAHVLASMLVLAPDPAAALSCSVRFEVEGDFTVIQSVADSGREVTARYSVTAEIRAGGNLSVSQQSGSVMLSGREPTRFSRIVVNNRSGAMATVRVTLTDGATRTECSGARALPDI
ncbi:curli-like amyloid fiber formation chaperone CsgH [Actibacterium sp. MT2.3-13A]|uniref:curli-like amyloid fiber formation chaperone CsgH n=1 Tax=Actibacterium sp. MT2.3-13A TaxID=2828332 RepID=UPI001BA56A67|nr:curli-like amyloid fiber formation chaperone CsgH [Actibacterium sp. MT2.3-13A]